MAKPLGFVPNYADDLFSGTAEYYAQYRVPYPQDLIDDLCKRTGVTGDGKLLDLACGPGRVTLPLATYFGEVWAIDLEPDMIAVAKGEAERLGIGHVKWLVGRAEDVEAVPESFELITIGEAFHRLNQRTIPELALGWLIPGQCLVTLGCNSMKGGKEPWQEIVREVFNKWAVKGVHNESTKKNSAPRGPVHESDVFKAAGFVDVENYTFHPERVWTFDSIIGNIYSWSGNLKNTLGNDVDAFESDMRDALVDFDASGHYTEVMNFGYTLARKPG